MDMRELESFCAAARLRSISGAALELGHRQSTVTKHVRKLEEEIGETLFDRSTHPISLTRTGTQLAELALPVVEQMSRLTHHFSRKDPRYVFKLASTARLASTWLPKVIIEFMADHPRTQVRLLCGLQEEILRFVEKRDVDVGIVPLRPIGPLLDFEALFEDRRVVVVPQGHPLLHQPLTSLDLIAQWPLILRPASTYTRTVLERYLQISGQRYHLSLEVDDLQAIKEYVALGMGISILPESVLMPNDYTKLAAVSLGSLFPHNWVGAVTVKGRILPRVAADFIETARRLSQSG